METTQVLFVFDTEDFVTPRSDDAIKWIAEILTGRGAKASFAITGDKARALWTRGRRDVIEAVKRHDVQYHSNTHMCWPRPTLELTRMNWDDGVARVLETERHGVEDVAEVFARRPGMWARPGGNWAPQEIYALKLLGLRAYSPSMCVLPDGRASWYAGVLHPPRHLSIESYFRPDGPQRMSEQWTAARLACRGTGLPVTYNAHPCMWATSLFYDLQNQVCQGVYPPKEQWRPAPLLTPAEMRRRLGILEQLVEFLQGVKGLQWVTYTDVLESFAEGDRWVSRRQLLSLAARASEEFDYWKLAGRWFSPADVFGVLSLALVRWSREGALPDHLPVREILGPPEPAGSLASGRQVPLPALLGACEQVEREIELHHRMPSACRLDGQRVGPASLLAAMGQAVAAIGRGQRPRMVRLVSRPPYPAVVERLFKEVKVDSSELPKDFRPGRIATYTRLQSWTLRPAVAAEGR